VALIVQNEAIILYYISYASAGYGTETLRYHHESRTDGQVACFSANT
jgi:hypothetical protein